MVVAETTNFCTSIVCTCTEMPWFRLSFINTKGHKPVYLDNDRAGHTEQTDKAT